MKKKSSDSAQLSLDFFAIEAAFDHTLEDVEKLQTEIAHDIEGITYADEPNTTAGSGGKSPESGVDRGTQARQLRPAGVESGGSLGLFESQPVGGAGSEGADRLAGRNQPAGESRTEIVGDGDGRAETDERGRVSDSSRNRVVVAKLDYSITEADQIGVGGLKAKFKANLAALELLRTLDSEGRQPTPQEQAVLVKYVGWGGMPQAFDPANSDWQKEYDALAAVLVGDAYDAARRSTQDAHYTPPEIIESMYGALHRMGFDGGRVLDAAVGTGNFVGKMPPGVRAKSQITGIELDPTTAAIAQYLYPNATIIQKGFQDVFIPDGYFDATVGNPPFGSQRVFDEAHQDLSRHSIHNYFLAKSLAKVAPGGIGAFVVSSYFLDASNSEARAQIAESSQFMGAVRLPNTAFKQIANTEVTTDIVFFQKALPGQEIDRSWIDVGETALADGTKVTLNKYYVDHPEMLMGDLALDKAQHGRQVLVVKPTSTTLPEMLDEAFKRLPEGVYVAPDRGISHSVSDIVVPDAVKIGGFFETLEGKIAMRLPDQLDKRDAKYAEFKSQRAEIRVRGMIQVRDAVTTLMRAEQQDLPDSELLQLRQALNKTYDGFVKKHGFLTAQPNRLAMSDDPEYPLLQALERDYDKGISDDIAKRDGIAAREPSAQKAAIFSRRVCSPRRLIESVETAKEALVVSMNERGSVDWTLMRRLYGKSVDEMAAELDGLVFQDPKQPDRWYTKDQYLSGNVKEKLRAAEAAAPANPAVAKNVEALRAVIPKDIEPIDIAIQLGSSWVPPAVVNEFVGHLLGNVSRNISYQASLGKWVTKIAAGDPTVFTVQWGTKEAPANQLIESILANRPIQVKDVVGHDEGNRPIYRLNAEKTAVASMKADEIRQAFLDWVWEEPGRRKELASIYNERFNTHVAPTYDGSHLTLPGASLAVELRPSQKNFIWRSVQDGNSLADHEVGTGKTFALCGVAMESRRMGLVRKPMLVVPNHLLLPWKDAFNTLYPDANVLVAEKEDFEKKNRQKLFGRIATGDWDAVIIAHSSLKKIGMPEETLQKILNEQIDDLADAVIQLKRENGDRVAIKEMEKIKDRMEAKLANASQTGSKDRVVTFDQLGVDALLVDEADEFKNLYIATSMSRVAGLGNLQGSEKAFDLFVKCRYIHDQYEGRGLTFATGTPVANSIAEVYTLQRYLQYDELKRRGIVHFDSWASTFGKVVSGWELDATGVNYKMNSRFAKFQNVPELVSMYRSFADVITNADLKAHALAAGKRFPLPNVKGGRPQNVVVERSPEQAQFMGMKSPVLDETGRPLVDGDGRVVTDWNAGSIIHRMEHMPKDPRIDNPLKVTNDARKAGLDFRLIDDQADDFAGSKTNEMIDRAMRLYEKWNDQKGTQLIFCDLSTPKAAAKPRPAVKKDAEEQEDAEPEESISMDELLSAGNSGRFNVYQDVKDKLIARGVPESEIAFIHDAKTDAQLAKLYDQMNRGEKRFCLGSTTKMGAGTNVQRLLVGLHNLDCPWRPRDLTQRLGRIIRQGNALFDADPDNFEVEIFNYSTKQTYDARMWQTIEYKAAAIEQFRRGDMLARVIDDVASEAANAAEMKAAATGNYLIFAQVQIQAELKKMEAAQSNHKRNIHALQQKIENLSDIEDRVGRQIEQIQKDIQLRDAAPKKQLQLKSGSIDFEEQKERLSKTVMDAVALAIRDKPKSLLDPRRPVTIGTYRGFALNAYCESAKAGKDSTDLLWFELTGTLRHAPGNLVYEAGDKFNVSGLFQRIDNALASLDGDIVASQERITAGVVERENAKAELAKPFPQEKLLADLRADMSEVMVELQRQQDDEKFKSRWKPRTIDIPGASEDVSDVDVAVDLSAEAILRAEVRQVKMDYLDSAFHPKRAEEIFLQDRHKRVLADVALQEQLVREIGDDESFARAIAHSHASTPATSAMREAAARCLEDRATLKDFGHKQKLTILSAKPDSGEHSGPVLQVAGDFLLQDSGRGVAMLHRKSRLEGDKSVIVPGNDIKIVYQNGKGDVKAQLEKHLSLTR